MPADNETFLTTQLEATEAQITAINAAIVSIVGGAQSFTLDTGQSRQTVTMSTLGELRLALREALQQRKELRAELGLPPSGGGAPTHIVPAF